MIKKPIILLWVGILAGLFNFADCQQKTSKEYVKYTYPNGQVSSEGYMVNGKPDGYWITYYVTGVKKSEGKRRNFMLDSTWVFYNQTGDTLEKINYINGKKNGYYVKYGYEQNENGRIGFIASKELYVNDKKEGIAQYFYPDGKLKSTVIYKDGYKEGISREFDKEGNVISLLEYHNNILINKQPVNRKDKDGRKTGKWLIFTADGKIYREENYKNGMLDGYYREYDRNGNTRFVLYYKNGALIENNNENDSINLPVDIRTIYDDNGQIIETGPFKKNIPVGVHRFYKNGKIINSIIYDDFGKKVSEGIIDETGKRKGSWKNFYPDGRVQSTGNYYNNVRNGTWKFYYPDGKTEQIGNYRNGREQGVWKWFYPDGSLHREENYFNGKRDGDYIEYDKEGNIIAKGAYLEGEKDGPWEVKVGDHRETGRYLLGLREGVWKYYYENGKIQFEGNYTRGMADGKHKYYYENGGIKEEQFYVMGRKEKTWKKYDEFGNIYMTITYKDDLERRINGVRIKLEKEVKTIR